MSYYMVLWCHKHGCIIQVIPGKLLESKPSIQPNDEHWNLVTNHGWSCWWANISQTPQLPALLSNGVRTSRFLGRWTVLNWHYQLHLRHVVDIWYSDQPLRYGLVIFSLPTFAEECFKATSVPLPLEIGVSVNLYQRSCWDSHWQLSRSICDGSGDRGEPKFFLRKVVGLMKCHIPGHYRNHSSAFLCVEGQGPHRQHMGRYGHRNYLALFYL